VIEQVVHSAVVQRIVVKCNKENAKPARRLSTFQQRKHSQGPRCMTGVSRGLTSVESIRWLYLV